MIWFSFPLDFVSQEVQDFKIVTVMVFRILLFFLRFGFFRFFCELDLSGFSDIVSLFDSTNIKRI